MTVTGKTMQVLNLKIQRRTVPFLTLLRRILASRSAGKMNLLSADPILQNLLIRFCRSGFSPLHLENDPGNLGASKGNLFFLYTAKQRPETLNRCARQEKQIQINK
jgi:hypothetical protein